VTDGTGHVNWGSVRFFTKLTRMAKRLDPWQHRALGAAPAADGVGFAVFAGHATSVTLATLDARGHEARHAMNPSPSGVWSGFLRGAAPGLRYGYFVDGPRDRTQGHAHDPTVRLVDPRARAFEGSFVEHPELRGHAHNDRRPWSVVVDDARVGRRFPPRPSIPWRDTVVYEAHVRAMTMQHPRIPRELRGTYGGLAHPEMLAHFRALGVTTIELLPVFEWATEEHLVTKGLSNHWGYAPVGFFAASRHFATDPARANEEFAAMVDALHDAGFEVVLDVVFNHTGEGGEDAHGRGMAWHFRGLDRRSYYRTDRANPARLVDFSGCGNTLDIDNPQVAAFVLDCLHHWVETMGVDGFRFDLGATLARHHGTFENPSKVLDALRTAPALRDTKLIMEPWDLGPGGYRVGQFGTPFREWNDKFRDTVRAFWVGDGAVLGDFATRIAGSADLFTRERGGATASINYVTAHDGFTLADLTAYDRKHNEDNLEDNRDGWDANRSWNGGEEGPTRHKAIAAERMRRMKSLLGTLLLAAGTPMLSHGDERARTQRGNNNAYCQDNPLTWIDWHDHACEAELTRWVASLIDLRLRHACFRHEHELRTHGPERGDVVWYRADAARMGPSDWRSGDPRLSWVLVEPASDDIGFLLLANGRRTRSKFVMPEAPHGSGSWRVVLDASGRHAPGERLAVGAATHLASGTLLIASEG
jgi:isoamylase